MSMFMSDVSKHDMFYILLNIMKLTSILLGFIFKIVEIATLRKGFL